MQDPGVAKGITGALLQKNCLFWDLDEQGGGNEGAVVGLTLRFALNARPTGSQGFAPGKATDKDKNKTKNQNKSAGKGTFLMR